MTSETSQLDGFWLATVSNQKFVAKLSYLN